MVIVTILLVCAASYLGAGFIFAILFVLKGIARIDEAAQGTGWGFRVIIFPGTVVFWPLLLKKWIGIYKKAAHD